jgi:hypothetical protein
MKCTAAPTLHCRPRCYYAIGDVNERVISAEIAPFSSFKKSGIDR